MFTVKEALRYEGERIKGSRFIAAIVPLANQAALDAIIEKERSLHPNATHHCWAARVMRPHWERAFDDGEPSGSAGRPILSAIQGRKLTEIAVVVTRYFGGTKLGVGGLVRAYGGVAAEALDRVHRIPCFERVTWTVRFTYADSGAVMHALDALGVTAQGVSYSTSIVCTLQVPREQEDEVAAVLRAATAGRVEILSEQA